MTQWNSIANATNILDNVWVNEFARTVAWPGDCGWGTSVPRYILGQGIYAGTEIYCTVIIAFNDQLNATKIQ